MKSRHLKEFVAAQEGRTIRQTSRNRGNTLPPPLRVIEVIHAASIGMSFSRHKGFLSVTLVKGARTTIGQEKGQD